MHLTRTYFRAAPSASPQKAAWTGVASLAGVLVCLSAPAVEPKIAAMVDQMACHGSSFQAKELHALRAGGLAAVLDYLLPDTAPAAPSPTAVVTGLADDDIRRLITQLNDDDFQTREQATEELIARARSRRGLIEEATQSSLAEVRLRAERILASWEAPPAVQLDAYLSGFWAYIEGIQDRERLLLLASRTMKAFEQGMPEGARLHLLRLCLAGVAHGRDDVSCDILRPLVRHKDARLAALAAETVGAYKADPRFVPQLLVDALQSDRQAVAEAALRFIVGCQDSERREEIRKALRVIFEKRDEPLKFQACLPLMRDFDDPDAWTYVVGQTQNKDGNRARTAFNWIGDKVNRP